MWLKDYKDEIILSGGADVERYAPSFPGESVRPTRYVEGEPIDVNLDSPTFSFEYRFSGDLTEFDPISSIKVIFTTGDSITNFFRNVFTIMAFSDGGGQYISVSLGKLQNDTPILQLPVGINDYFVRYRANSGTTEFGIGSQILATTTANIGPDRGLIGSYIYSGNTSRFDAGYGITYDHKLWIDGTSDSGGRLVLDVPFDESFEDYPVIANRAGPAYTAYNFTADDVVII